MVLHAMLFKAHAMKLRPRNHHSKDALQEQLSHLERLKALKLKKRKKIKRRRKKKLKLLWPNTHTLLVDLQRIQLAHLFALITRVKTEHHAIRLSHHAKNLEKYHL